MDSRSIPAFVSASWVAMYAYPAASLINLKVFLSINSLRFISIEPDTWLLKPISLYIELAVIPDLPILRFSSTSLRPLPIQETMPMPVTTTLFIRIHWCL